MDLVIPLNQVSLQDINQVGGKNASLGEMIQNLQAVNIAVPDGFAVTAHAYLLHIQQNGLGKRIQQRLQDLSVSHIEQLQQAGQDIRHWVVEQALPSEVEAAIRGAYNDESVAVRSSATAEDLPTASFAGQQESYLNVNGIENVLNAVRQVFASLYTDRAIAYRVHQGFKHEEVAISVTIQRMIRSDKACSGVLFTIDTESGFTDAIFITASYGLGELIVQGVVNPDEYYVYKPNVHTQHQAILNRHLGNKHQQMIYADGDQRVKVVEVSESMQQQYCLNDDEVKQLANMALAIEEHYQRPMDVEWAKDGFDGKLYILQARPETVSQRKGTGNVERYHLQASDSKVITTGRSIGQKIGKGTARVVTDLNHMQNIDVGDVLVADMTDPDWEPIMKKVSAIVTNRGGRTCHAAIIARELGIPAVVGCNDATDLIHESQQLTVSCAEGDTGLVYEGDLAFQVETIKVESLPDIPVDIMLNIANPERAFSFANLPNKGVGLARLEFLISNSIGIHPRAALDFSNLSHALQQQMIVRMQGARDPIRYYINKCRDGIAMICAAFAPQPVIVRLSDFKSNEYANLLGGRDYEPQEENPMLGFRGCGRYISPEFSECFALECEAVKAVWQDLSLKNLAIMIPFVRTLQEAEQVTLALEKNGIPRGDTGIKVYMMCELPSNCLLADDFLDYFDGFSIGSNDLTQLTLGVDRDSALVAPAFDERDASVKQLLSMAISACNKRNKYVGICGQAPSDYPEFAKWLMSQGIKSMSLNPDTVIDTWLYLANP